MGFICIEFLLSFNLSLSLLDCEGLFTFYHREDHSHAYADRMVHRIYVNQYYWDQVDWVERREIGFHELGHLLLGLDHCLTEYGWQEPRIMRPRFTSSRYVSWDKLVEGMRREYDRGTCGGRGYSHKPLVAPG